jgi:hypothetical protein
MDATAVLSKTQEQPEAAQDISELRSELASQILHHRKWEFRDFLSAQVFVWIGIGASVASTLYASGVLDIGRQTAAMIGAAPGVIIVVDKTFKFAARASWHAKYRASLNGLFRKLRDEHLPASSVSQAFSKLEIDMEAIFPPLDTTNIGGKPK